MIVVAFDLKGYTLRIEQNVLYRVISLPGLPLAASIYRLLDPISVWWS